MLPLDTKARWSPEWQEPTLLKVAGLQEFAAGEFPLERMLLDLRVPELSRREHRELKDAKRRLRAK